MKIIENHLNELDRGLYNKSFSFAFPERAAVVRGAISRKINARFVRTPAAPVLSTDQGVRFSPSAQLFYEAHTRIANVPILSSSDLINSLRKAPVNRLDKLLDAYLLFFGNYKSIAQAILLRKDEILAEISENYEKKMLIVNDNVSKGYVTQFFNQFNRLLKSEKDKNKEKII